MATHEALHLQRAGAGQGVRTANWAVLWPRGALDDTALAAKVQVLEAFQVHIVHQSYWNVLGAGHLPNKTR